MIKKICISILILAFVLSDFAVSAFAAVNHDYMLEKNGTVRQPIPKSFMLKDTIFYLGEKAGTLNEPNDIHISKDGSMLIADSGNDRVLKLSLEGDVMDVYEEANGKPFKNPQGVYADKDGSIYIADTDNKRIVKLSSKGKFVEEFVSPESELLGSDFVFTPRKVAVSPTGYIYVIRHQWLMNIDAYNNFRGFVGATQVGFDLGYVIKKFFSNEAQKKAMVKREPPSCLSFDLAYDGSVYITTVDHKGGQLKKLNAVGKNIYPKQSFFGEMVIDEKGNFALPNFIDLAVDDNEIIYLLEQWSGKIYVYDMEGNNLAVFGGLGEGKGKFQVPSAIDVDSDGNVYVIDTKLNNIQVYAPTHFIRRVIEAVEYYANGEYLDAVELWNEVISIDESYSLANRGIAKALMKQKNWEEALKYYRLADDKPGYSMAFVKFRHQQFRDNFALVVLSVIAVALLIIFIVKFLYRFVKKELDKYSSII